MTLAVRTPAAQSLSISDGFGNTASVPLMGGQSIALEILLEDQDAISVRVSDGGSLSIQPGLAFGAGVGVGTAAGAATVAGVGASTAAAVGTSDGAATVSGVGEGTTNVQEGAGSAAGSATVAGVGEALTDGEGAGTAAGASTVSGVGASTAAAAGASDGSATVAGVGASLETAEGAGTSAGIAVVAGVGASTAEAAGAADGIAAVSGAGASTAASSGTSAGVATVSAVSETPGSVEEGAGTSAGAATVSGAGASTAESLGISDGVATVSGVGASTAEALGISDGVATVTAVGEDAAGGAFHPTDLFGVGDDGGVYEISPTYCFTDTARTTAAAVGDAVAAVEDQSGNGHHLTQATVADRPILRQDANSDYYLEHDGTDDFIEVTWGTPLAIPVSMAVAAERVASRRIVAETTKTNNLRLHLSTDSSTDFEVYSGSVATRTIPAGTNFVGAVVFDTQSSIIRTNGGVTDPADVGNYNASGGFRIGGNNVTPTPSLYTATYFYGGMAIDRKLTTTEFSDLETWLADRSGVTL